MTRIQLKYYRKLESIQRRGVENQAEVKKNSQESRELDLDMKA